MMAFIGTPAQIAWAADIRRIFIEKCPEEVDGRDIVYRIASAKWWIDHRTRTPAQLCELAVAGKIPLEYISTNGSIRNIGITKNGRFLVTCDDPKKLTRFMLRIPGAKQAGEFQFTVDDFMAAEVMDLGSQEGFRISDEARRLAESKGYVEMVTSEPGEDGIIDELRDCG